MKGDGFVDRIAIQTTAEADKAEIVVSREGGQQFRHEPSAAEQHVVLPGRQERRARFTEALIGRAGSGSTLQFGST